MPSVSLKIDLSAARGVADAMAPDRLERILIAAAKKAMAPVVRAIRSAAPVGETSVKKRHLAGMLQRSISFRVRTQHGPLRFQVTGTPYGHLVESGHKIVRGGRIVGQAKARPFVEPVITMSRDKIQQTIADEIIRALTLAARIRKAVGH